MTTTELVSIKGAGFSWDGRQVLENVDLSLKRGEIVTLIGPNGAGKSTLVRIALGLLTPATGTVTRVRGIRIGYTPQSVDLDQSLPLTVRRYLRLVAGATDLKAATVLEETGAGGIAEQPMHGLSGGELRRVLLARALLRDPDLLVLDEPTAGVDVGGQAEVFKLIQKIRDARGCGVLLVSHDLHLVMAATNRVVCLNHHVCCDGRPEDVRQHPQYLSLFGAELARDIAIYTHHHDHHHNMAGQVEHAEHG